MLGIGKWEFYRMGFFGMYKTFQFSCLQRHEYIGVIAFTELNGVFECCRYCAHKIRAIPISMRKWRVHSFFYIEMWGWPWQRSTHTGALFFALSHSLSLSDGESNVIELCTVWHEQKLSTETQRTHDMFSPFWLSSTEWIQLKPAYELKALPNWI